MLTYGYINNKNPNTLNDINWTVIGMGLQNFRKYFRIQHFDNFDKSIIQYFSKPRCGMFDYGSEVLYKSSKAKRFAKQSRRWANLLLTYKYFLMFLLFERNFINLYLFSV